MMNAPHKMQDQFWGLWMMAACMCLVLPLLLPLLPGVALVESHGDALVQQLLPQFESYLEPAAASRLGLTEARYDLVREGVVVLLGMMAGHLAPADTKVGGWVGGCICACMRCAWGEREGKARC